MLVVVWVSEPISRSAGGERSFLGWKLPSFTVAQLWKSGLCWNLEMSSVSIVVSGSSAATHSGSGGWCKWRWRNNSGGGSKNGNSNVGGDLCDLSSAFAFFLVSFVLLGSIAGLYSRLMLTPNVRAGLSALGCREDNEGSWAIGVFYGDSPFSLKPVEDVSLHSKMNSFQCAFIC